MKNAVFDSMIAPLVIVAEDSTVQHCFCTVQLQNKWLLLSELCFLQCTECDRRSLDVCRYIRHVPTVWWVSYLISICFLPIWVFWPSDVLFSGLHVSAASSPVCRVVTIRMRIFWKRTTRIEVVLIACIVLMRMRIWKTIPQGQETYEVLR